jgi:hypothetical protein
VSKATKGRKRAAAKAGIDEASKPPAKKAARKASKRAPRKKVE